MDNIKGNYANGNADNLTEAVHGLDIFTKNWCMNCAETERMTLYLTVRSANFPPKMAVVW